MPGVTTVGDDQTTCGVSLMRRETACANVVVRRGGVR
jgi:hypothetical protein